MKNFRHLKPNAPKAAKEGHFINLFLRDGVGGGADVNLSKIEYCEKRAYLEPGEGVELLKREEVQKRIKEKMD